MMQTNPSHNHYFKSVEGLKTIDVYRVLELFDVDSPSLQHAIKKLLVAGGRGAGKDIKQDVREAIDSLNRWLEMREQDDARFQKEKHGIQLFCGGTLEPFQQTR
jgi:hypothetical protein